MQTEKRKDKHIEQSVFYKALAHPVRLAIIKKLFLSKVNNCHDFVVELSFAQATISEHLKKLKKAGLISVTKKGSSSEYSLNKQGFRQFRKILEEMNMIAEQTTVKSESKNT